jgi:2-deoxy-D-gluconate 3-dehydrogenase
MSVSFDLTGTTAVVTGARRGIGFAMAEGLAQAGADIIAVSAGQEADGGVIGARVRELGRSFEGHAVDFRDRDAIAAFGAAVRDRADILVNNAGTIRRSPAAEHPLEWWDEVLDVNLRNQFVLTQAVAAGMLERGYGRIVFTASLLSFQGGHCRPREGTE